MLRPRLPWLFILALAASFTGACIPTPKPPDYDAYVWPPPPDKPRIRLRDIIYGRLDVMAPSGLQRALLGATPQTALDWFKKPFAVEFDTKGRILVTDTAVGAVFRFDRAAKRADVLGTRGSVPLRQPLGLDVGLDDAIYVADVGLKQIVAFEPDGNLIAVFGRPGELENPTDVALSPDESRLFVADSKAHRIVIFDRASGQRIGEFGRRGDAEGEFSFPTSLTFDRSGNLIVVDQLNSRLLVMTAEGRLLDRVGSLGVGFANFVRPKDVAVDELGIVYVTDAAFGNVQIFSPDLELLTFVGSNGSGPGQFTLASGVAVSGDRFAVVDQLGRRVQVFQFIVPKDSE